VTAYVGGELVFESAQVFLAPEVADDVFSFEAEVGPVQGYFLFRKTVAGVEESYGFGPVF